MIVDTQRNQHLGEMLRDALLTYKSNVALIEMDRHRELRQLTYIETLLEAETVATVLQEHVSSGERCAILMANQSRWVTSTMATFFSGAVLVPIDYKLPPADQWALLQRAQPRALFVDYPLYRDLLRLGLDDRTFPMQVLVADLERVPPKLRAEVVLGKDAQPFPAADPALADRCDHRARSRDDLASIVYTSGTGGKPKGCMLTHGNYLATVQSVSRLFPMEETDRYFSVLPSNHAIDFVCGVLYPYLYGAAVVHQRTLRAEFLVPTMSQCRITQTALVPRILRELKKGIEEEIDKQPEWKQTLIRSLIELNDLATMKRPNHALSRRLLYPLQQRFGGRLRTIIAGGSYVEPELADYFYRLGFPVAIGYGLTESCLVLTINDLSPFRANTVGAPIDGVTLEVRDPGPDGVGEIYARGPTIMLGYENDPEQTADALVDGWLRTEDLGRIDPSGHLQLRGRAKNMIVTEGGKNVYPEEIEATFEGLPCENMCILAESYLWPTEAFHKARLTIVVRPRSEVTLERLKTALVERNRQLVDYKRLGSFVLHTDAFPMTASMKVKRADLAKQVRAAHSERYEL